MIRRNNSVHGVVFDFDGIVVDSEHIWENAWGAYSERHGRSFSPEDAMTLQGLSTKEWSAKLAELVGGGDDAETVAKFCVARYVVDVVGGDGPLLEGALELIETVSARVPIALASSSPRQGLEAALNHHGVAKYFTATVSSEEVPRGKPSPDVYLEAARRIGLDPAYGIGIEDSSNGIRAAKAAGLEVVALPNRIYPPKPDALALAEFQAADHGQVLDYVIQRIGAREDHS